MIVIQRNRGARLPVCVRACVRRRGDGDGDGVVVNVIQKSTKKYKKVIDNTKVI